MADKVAATVDARSPEDEPDEAGARILAAASACAERDGLQNVLVEDIVRESGIPRTTVYRRFGGREAILRAMIIEQSRPFRLEVSRVSMGPAGLRDRAEQALVITIASLASYPWARPLLEKGVSKAEMALFEAVYHESSDGALKALLFSAEGVSCLRRAMTAEQGMPWLIRQIIEFGCELRGDEIRIREAVRRFLLPVLLPEAGGQATDTLTINQRLDLIEATLLRIELQTCQCNKLATSGEN